LQIEIQQWYYHYDTKNYLLGKIIGFVMKKYIFLMISMFYSNTMLCCPFQFCPEDQRPFFEQYETTSITSQTKEEK